MARIAHRGAQSVRRQPLAQSGERGTEASVPLALSPFQYWMDTAPRPWLSSFFVSVSAIIRAQRTQCSMWP